MSEKIYCGKGKETKYGVNLSVCLTDIPKEFIKESKGKKYVNLTLNSRKEKDEWGNTHYLTVNTYKKEETKKEDSGRDLPF